jgi:hypothetical protein
LEDADYFANPAVKGIAAEGTRWALRDVLGYRLYFDLRRGWRITNPNLEQLGLLKIDYRLLEDCCRDEEAWSTAHDTTLVIVDEMRHRANALAEPNSRVGNTQIPCRVDGETRRVRHLANAALVHRALDQRSIVRARDRGSPVDEVW